MKKQIVVGFAWLWGCIIAFWLFALAFTRSDSAFAHASIMPLFLGCIGCLLLVLFSQEEKKLITLGIIVPSLSLFGLFFFALLMEGTVGWGHLIIIGKLITAVILGLIIALLLKLIAKKISKDPV